jgi:hypothetical protein
LKRVTALQYGSGAFPLSIGFEDLSYPKGLSSKPEIKRWRDLLPTPNWNAWDFWMLTELLPRKTNIPEPNIKFPLILETDAEEKEGPYKIVEEKEEVTFFDLKRKRLVGIFDKKDEVAKLCLIMERGDFWRTVDSLNRYPNFLRRIILGLPHLFS